MEENKKVTTETDNNNQNDEVNAIKAEVKQLSEELEMKSQELMNMISDPRVMRSYQAVRNDLFGIGERKPMTKAEKKKKKAKRRMAKKSKR